MSRPAILFLAWICESQAGAGGHEPCTLGAAWAGDRGRGQGAAGRPHAAGARADGGGAALGRATRGERPYRHVDIGEHFLRSRVPGTGFGSPGDQYNVCVIVYVHA